MNWIKKGLIYVPEGHSDWSVSHAQVPVADYIEEDHLIRIYFATRDSINRSRITYIEVDADNPLKIIRHAGHPILDLGRLGTFDDCGTMPSWIVNIGKKKYLYYIGWNIRNTVPYYNSIGLAISTDGGHKFDKISEGPLFDRNIKEPYFSASSCVIVENDLWRNWYLSCTEYRIVHGRVEPRYHLKYAESLDGINWKREGIVAIDYKSDEEAGIVKASVIRDGTIYKMWFSYRNFDNYRTDPRNSYKIGYAESKDGIHWDRRDELAGIGLSESGWDSEMIAYPHVLRVGNRLLMFYNGNGFGQTGFGYAEAEVNPNI